MSKSKRSKSPAPERKVLTVKLTGAQRIARERRHHTTLGYDFGELALAAACLATPENLYRRTGYGSDGLAFLDPWPFVTTDQHRKRGRNGKLLPNHLDPVDVEWRIRQLEKAGALIAAEIDRLLGLP